jgi:DNA adenine methylase
MSKKIQKPFIKWVGGKTQMIDKIVKKIPPEMENYHELFLGGGSVLLAILGLQRESKITIKNKIFAYDFNLALINTFRQIKINYKNVIGDILQLINEFGGIAVNTFGQRGKPENINEETYKNSREHYYYWIRDKYNACEKNDTMAAAYFIFLNKTGFRGMYREGKRGFNIPYGLKDTKKIPGIIDNEVLKNVSSLIQNVEFIHADFEDSIKKIKGGDFVYLDPPYAPEKKNSFVGYTEAGFNLEKHQKLFSEIKAFNEKNIRFLMSNANVDFVVEHFENYNREEILARRAINSKNPGKKAVELFINN